MRVPPSEAAVVILNWNGAGETANALDSLISSGLPASRLIVVDNGSSGDDVRMLRARYPTIKMISMRNNHGFARAVNIGAAAALRDGARYIVLFNNDAWIEPGVAVIPTLIDALAADPTLGAVGPLIVETDGDGAARIQSAGYRYSLFFPIARGQFAGARADGERRYRAVTCLSGSCLAVSAEAFRRAGGLDEDFFLYGDDVDFALRLRKAGYAERLVPQVRVFHRRAASNGIASSRHIYTGLRSTLILVKKHARWYHLPSATLTLIAAAIALTALNARAGRLDGAGASLRAFRDFLAGRWGGYEGSWAPEPLFSELEPLRYGIPAA